MEDNSNPLISVIIPAYQAEQTIERAVRSAIDLAGANGEVIVVNDGSTDATGDIAKAYLRPHSADVCINQNNQGRSVARNVGLHAAHGEWVAFLDADDWVFTESVAEVRRAAEQSSADIIMFRDARNYRVFTGDSEVVDGSCACDAIMRPFLVYGTPIDQFNCRTVWGKLYRTKAIRSVNFIAGLRFGEDALFNVSIYGKSKIELVDICLYRYDMAVGSTCGRFQIEDVEYLARFIDAAHNLVATLDISDEELNCLCLSELLEMFYRAGKSNVDIREVANMFSNILCDRKWLDLSFVPKKRNKIEEIRAKVTLSLIRHERTVLALQFERIRSITSGLIKGISV